MILVVVLTALAVGALLAWLTGQPLLFVAALVVGALAANRIGYRHQASAMKNELTPMWPGQAPASSQAPARTVEQRIAELDRLRATGTITEREYAEKRAAILSDL